MLEIAYGVRKKILQRDVGRLSFVTKKRHARKDWSGEGLISIRNIKRRGAKLRFANT